MPLFDRHQEPRQGEAYRLHALRNVRLGLPRRFVAGRRQTLAALAARHPGRRALRRGVRQPLGTSDHRREVGRIRAGRRHADLRNRGTHLGKVLRQLEGLLREDAESAGRLRRENVRETPRRGDQLRSQGDRRDEHRQGDLLADDHEVRNAESRRRLAVGGPHRRRGTPR